jgi:uncharacterized protein YceK
MKKLLLILVVSVLLSGCTNMIEKDLIKEPIPSIAPSAKFLFRDVYGSYFYEIEMDSASYIYVWSERTHDIAITKK